MDNDFDILFSCTGCGNGSSGNGDPEKRTALRCAVPNSVKTYKKGEYVACQGDPVAHLYMLTKGRVKTEIVSDPGLTLHVDEIRAPYPLAAAFLFADDSRFPVDVIALEDSEIILIPKEAVEERMMNCPYFLRGFMAFTANRMQFLSERLKMFSLKGIKTKLAFYLLQRTRGDRFELGRSIASLAEYFGVERPSLSRAISEMVRDGIIEFEGGKGRIIGRKALKDML